ncbi:MAG: PhoU domain-containing protein [Promethearchaeota archaeon]
MQPKIHQRRIQKFAKYSFAITLPVHWVRHNYLPDKNGKNGKITKKKNRKINRSDNEHSNNSDLSIAPDSTINIYEMPDGSLQLYPEKRKTKKNKRIHILELDELIKENPNFIKEKGITFMLISYYMNGATGVEIQSKHPIPPEFIDQVEKLQGQLLFNWNVTRDSSHKLLIKNVFSESPENIFQDEIPRYLRESFSILLWMLEDINSTLQNGNYDVLLNISKQDQRIDRYYFFIVRQIRTIFEHPQISKPLNYSYKKLIDLRLLAKLIEDVGDSLKDCAKILYEFQGVIKNFGIQDFLIRYFNVLIDAYSNLSDNLKDNVGRRSPQMGFNTKIMSLIQQYRKIGKKLNNEWVQLAKSIQIDHNQHIFIEYFYGSQLIQDLEAVFKNIFDFTNIFF